MFHSHDGGKSVERTETSGASMAMSCATDAYWQSVASRRKVHATTHAKWRGELTHDSAQTSSHHRTAKAADSNRCGHVHCKLYQPVSARECLLEARESEASDHSLLHAVLSHPETGRLHGGRNGLRPGS
jgi:hypothetical protein